MTKHIFIVGKLEQSSSVAPLASDKGRSSDGIEKRKKSLHLVGFKVQTHYLCHEVAYSIVMIQPLPFPVLVYHII